MWRALWWLLPLHVALPYGLSLLHRRAGFEAASYVVAGIHVAFPAVYLLVRRWLPGSTLELLALLLLNHLAMGAVGLGLWLWPG